MTVRSSLASLPREARDTLFVLMVTAWIIVPPMGYLPVWASAAAAAMLLWRAWIAYRGLPLPPRWVPVVLVVMAVAATLATHRTLFGRDAGVTLVVLMLALKTFELRARRDAMVVFFLGFFTMLSSFFYSQSLLTAAAMLVALLGLLTALVNAHMPVGRPPLAQSLRTAGKMAALGAPIMIALFMLFPRMAPLWGMPGDSMTGRSGLSNSMSVGNLAALALNDAVALRLRFEGDEMNTPPQSAFYFRGPVLSQFDGREWTAEPLRGNAPGAMQRDLPTDLQVQGPSWRYEITQEPQKTPWLMLLEASPTGPTFTGTAITRARMAPDLQWLAQRPLTDTVRYRAQSYPQFRHGPTDTMAGLAALTALPSGFNPRTLAMAEQMLADPSLVAGGTPALINAAVERLRTGGYHYTLEPGVYGTHTADEFWFDRKAGFCEHIASAFVVLMRALHVPARIVTGYQGGDRNPVDGYWTVRQSDAHAWAEVWIKGQGWVRVDPTGAVSPNRIGDFQRLRAPSSAFTAAVDTVVGADFALNMRAVWEAVNNSWNQWILNYTQSRQLDVLRSLGFESPNWQTLTTLLGALLCSAMLAGLAWSLWQRSQHDPWLRLLGQARKRLARAGLNLPNTMPPRAMAAQVQAQFGSPAAPLVQWLIQLEQVRYAPQHSASLRTLQRHFRHLPWPTANQP